MFSDKCNVLNDEYHITKVLRPETPHYSDTILESREMPWYSQERSRMNGPGPSLAWRCFKFIARANIGGKDEETLSSLIESCASDLLDTLR